MKTFNKKFALIVLAAGMFAAPSASFAQCWRPFGGLFSGCWQVRNCQPYGACEAPESPAPCAPVEEKTEEPAPVETCVYPEDVEPCAPCAPTAKDACSAVEFSAMVEKELSEMGETEKQMFARLNQYRRANGLNEVVFEKTALQGCRDHSLSMAQWGGLYHNNPRGWSEICAYAGSVDQAFSAWLSSWPHRSIMFSRCRRAAASYAFDRHGRGFWTIRFAY